MPPPEPDLLLVNGNVLTMDPGHARASAVAVTGGRITAVYDGKPDTGAKDVIDLNGATLIPGFHDAHNHMIGFGLTLSDVDCRVTSLDELYARIAERAKTTPDGDWIGGAGYDQTKTGGHPHRDVLDTIAPNHRVWLKHTSGHMCVVNSLVLRDLGIDATSPHVDGGRVTADAAGRPTGLLEERAQELVIGLTRPAPLSVLADAVARAGERYLTEGITSVTEAGIGGGWIGQSPVELAAYQAARDQGRLHVRVELMVASDVLHELGAHPDDGMALGLDLGIRTGFGDDWLRLGPMKIFTDGSLVGRTAAMSAPYDGDPGNSGYLQADADDLTARIVAAHRAGGGSPRTRSATAPSTWPWTPSPWPLTGIPGRLPGTGSSTSPPRVRIRSSTLSERKVLAVGQGRFATELGDGMMAVRRPAARLLALPAAQPPGRGRRHLRQLGPPGRRGRPAARHPRHGQPPHRLRRPLQPGGSGHRRRRAARLHLGFGLCQQAGAREGLDRAWQAGRPHGPVRRPHRRQPGPHRRP